MQVDIQGKYIPGSIVKMITEVALMSNTNFNPLDKFRCDGSFQFGDRIFGCWYTNGHGEIDLSSAIASSTMFVEMLKGKTIEEAKQIKDKEIAEALELPPIKLHCSVLAEEGIKKAIENWEEKTKHRKHNQVWEDPNGYGY